MYSIFSILAGRATMIGIGLLATSIFVGSLLLRKNLKERAYRKDANDASKLEECFEAAKNVKEANLCYHKNKSDSFKNE